MIHKSSLIGFTIEATDAMMTVNRMIRVPLERERMTGKIVHR
jgi:hypothetical protein